jgi:hypothetical protein
LPNIPPFQPEIKARLYRAGSTGGLEYRVPEGEGFSFKPMCSHRHSPDLPAEFLSFPEILFCHDLFDIVGKVEYIPSNSNDGGLFVWQDKQFPGGIAKFCYLSGRLVVTKQPLSDDKSDIPCQPMDIYVELVKA